MTLREVLEQVTGTREDEKMGKNELLALDDRIIIEERKTLADDLVSAVVYENGYVLYREGRAFTVFHVEDMKNPLKHATTSDDYFSTLSMDIYLDEDWFLGIMMFGNRRLIRNQEERHSSHVCFLDRTELLVWDVDIAEEVETDIDIIEMHQMLDNVIEEFTTKQKEIIYLLREGKDQQQIAKALGITQQAASKRYAGTCRRINEIRVKNGMKPFDEKIFSKFFMKRLYKTPKRM